MIAGVILAGGRATRMGGADKALLPLSGRPMLAHVIDRLRSQVGAMALNANGDPSRFDTFELPVLPDDFPDYRGPLAGISAGMAWAKALPEPATHIVTVAADTPFFPENLVARLFETAAGNADAIVLAATTTDRQPTFGLWPASLAGVLDNHLRRGDSLKITDFVDAHPNAVARFPAESDPFFNINTPDDLTRAEAILARDDA